MTAALTAALLGVGLNAGGAACLKHLVLRRWLIRNGSTPWNYVRFLDHAAQRILLRKVGGGYVFIHRMLLEYFAAIYVDSGIEMTRDPINRAKRCLTYVDCYPQGNASLSTIASRTPAW